MPGAQLHPYGARAVASIDTAAFHGHIHEFGAIYQGILARELIKLNVEVGIDPRTNITRLRAIPEDVVDEFSKRSREGEAAARKRATREGRDWVTMTPEQQATFKKAGTHATRLDKETNTPDWDAWRKQVEQIGWKHRSVISAEPLTTISRAERVGEADQVGPQHLAAMLSKRAVIGQGDARLAVARGFIAARGVESTDDIAEMVKHWANAGVLQDGGWTKLLWKEVERGKIKITTELHRNQENERIHRFGTSGSRRPPACADLGGDCRSGRPFRLFLSGSARQQPTRRD
jgi:hypothetical protein